MQVQVGNFRFSAQQVRSHPEGVNEALLKAKREIGHALCHCMPGVDLKLVIRERNGQCLLAVWPEDGPNHHRDCPFHRASDALSGVQGHRKGALQETEDGFSIRPTITLTRRRAELRAPVHERDAATDRERVSRARMSLLAVLHYLWEQADQNRWNRGWRRDYGRLQWSLAQVIAHGKMGRYGLAELVYMPPRFNRDAVREINAGWAQWKARFQQQEGATTVRTGLILAELHSIEQTRHGFGVKLAQHAEMVYCSAEMRGALAKKYARALATVGRRDTGTCAVALLATEVSQKGNVNIVDGALMLTTTSYIPVDSTYEAKLAQHLVTANRSFIKPLHYDVREQLLPDFVLTDTDPETYLEVFGMDTAQYTQRKQEKIKIYAEQGKQLWTWEAHTGVPWPHLPKAS